MTPDVWLSVLFGLLAGASYVLWCAERLPRARVLIAVVGLACLGAGLYVHDHGFPVHSAQAVTGVQR